ncbi:hypothetical protein ABFS83_04G031000 [Erythranthe nasuta]
MMSKSCIVYFSVALVAITILWASKAAAAPSAYCPMVKLGSKEMKNLGACTNACKKTFGGGANAVCLRKKKLEFDPEELKLKFEGIKLKFSCFCGCSIKRSKKKKCPPATVQTPPPADDDNSSNDSPGGGNELFVTRKFLN